MRIARTLTGMIGGAGLLLAGLAAVNSGALRNTAGGGPEFAAIDLPAPPRAAPTPRTVRYAADHYGQFWIDGTADGVAFRFLADTGASEIVFGKRDARRLGLDIKALRWDGRASTANGIVRTASARLTRLTVGPFTLTDVPVSINEGELAEPLLGMAFLRRLNVSIQSGTLTLSGEP
ncbi:MAG: TIGR02281 family clan AA aspartic protease [Rhizobiaceae bacterium]